MGVHNRTGGKAAFQAKTHNITAAASRLVSVSLQTLPQGFLPALSLHPQPLAGGRDVVTTHERWVKGRPNALASVIACGGVRTNASSCSEQRTACVSAAPSAGRDLTQRNASLPGAGGERRWPELCSTQTVGGLRAQERPRALQPPVFNVQGH